MILFAGCWAGDVGLRGLADFSGGHVVPRGQGGGFDRIGHQWEGGQNVCKFGFRQAVQPIPLHTSPPNALQ